MKYYLINPKTRVRIEGIIIDETAKEQFKTLMGWDEMTWRRNTDIIREEKEFDLSEEIQVDTEPYIPVSKVKEFISLLDELVYSKSSFICEKCGKEGKTKINYNVFLDALSILAGGKLR